MSKKKRLFFGRPMAPEEKLLAGWQTCIVIAILLLHAWFLYAGMNMKSALLGTSLLTGYGALVSFLSLFIPDLSARGSKHRAAAIAALFTAALTLSTEAAFLHSFYPAVGATAFFLLSIGLVAKYLKIGFKRIFWTSIAQGAAIYASVKYGPLLVEQVDKFS